MPSQIREIPYNYTSFSDHEIVKRFLGEACWQLLQVLRDSRRTGRSARLLFEILGDMWVVQRNPYIQDDLLANAKRRLSLTQILRNRLDQIIAWANNNAKTLQLAEHARRAVQEFETQLDTMRSQRQKIVQRMESIMHRNQIDFSGFARISHATDASDWRVEFPFVVLLPDRQQQLAELVQACIDLDLVIIPRGGGTGYTGGVVPLHAYTAVINLEKLEGIEPLKWLQLPGFEEKIATVCAEAGVVTKRLTELATTNKLVFAVDPTSQDASTIGGNVAMNAGGKKAVMWGTCLDNLLSWWMVTPLAQWLEVERLNHHMGKIHEIETAEFKLTLWDRTRKTKLSEQTLRIPGASLRKSGLGKDVTDKFLAGLPGIQKEGCDGIITSARFVLHRRPSFVRTVCLEFFGNDLRIAVPAIVECKSKIDALGDVHLAGMEHLDERYVKAIQYATKAPRPDHPKMVLLIDLVGDDEYQLAKASSEIIQLAQQRGAEGFIAISPEARQRFWSDRARTAAIATHTNAFKINEDVVIPLQRLAEYSESVERINIEQSLLNKLSMVSAVTDFLRSPSGISNDYLKSEENKKIFADKKSVALALLNRIQQQWQQIYAHLDDSAQKHSDLLTPEALAALQKKDHLYDLIQRRELRISYRKRLAQPLYEIFSGEHWQQLRNRLAAIHQQVLSSRIIVALHMHAGDGNVHTNIPVNSNDYHMLQMADKIVERIMALATDLGGVISGEHGIGITKIHYLSKDYIDAFARYKNAIDPKQRFNRDKLSHKSGLSNAYTPSLRLVQQEALILEASELDELNDAIKHCLRCGKCKPVCATHEPRANLLYSPRNKILATGLIIEAFLYEEQTKRGLSLRHFEELNDVADHCTVCHRCLPPCPVNIDFGDVSMLMRNILRDKNKKSLNLGTRLSMAFLNATDPTTIKLMRNLFIKTGFWIQNAFYHMAKKLLSKDNKPQQSTGKASVVSQAVHFIKKPLPAKIPRKTSRAILNLEDSHSVAILRNTNKITEQADGVFYFPGCGSERLFSQIALATLALLFELDTQTILPPGYLCCGYPQRSNGDVKKAQQISTDNRVLFHRVANSLAYLDIKTVVVSCGTCLDQIKDYQFDKIFPGSRLLDIHEYLMEKEMAVNSTSAVQYLYHDPCHSPMKQYDPIQVTEKLLGRPTLLSDRCCGEAGTFAVSRADLASQVRVRKQAELHRGIEKLTGSPVAKQGEVKLLTSCPSCQQGLSRYREDTGLSTEYIVVELAKQLLGENWEKQFIHAALHGGIERVMF